LTTSRPCTMHTTMVDARYPPTTPTRSVCAKYFSCKRRQCLDSDALAYGYIHPDHISKTKHKRTLSVASMYGHDAHERPPPTRFNQSDFRSVSPFESIPKTSTWQVSAIRFRIDTRSSSQVYIVTTNRGSAIIFCTRQTSSAATKTGPKERPFRREFGPPRYSSRKRACD
jgi:hypothetical protein